MVTRPANRICGPIRNQQKKTQTNQWQDAQRIFSGEAEEDLGDQWESLCFISSHLRKIEDLFFSLFDEEEEENDTGPPENPK